MSVVFEEENTQLQNIASASQYGQPVGAASRSSDSPATKFAMLTFAIICLIGACYVPSLINPPQKKATVYIEDITAERMRLIPPDEQARYLSGLPSRNSATNSSQ